MTLTTLRDSARRGFPEITLALLASGMFLGCLGSVDLWGKREQRASAEALDTVDQGHWLVARIQGRKRLEKPPLPRWTSAALMTVTGRRDEVIVRLPAALSALLMIGLVYDLGRRMAGRSVGLASGLILTSTGFFVAELRQAGNDGPLAAFTTLALYCAWRRLHGEPSEDDGEPTLGARGWSLAMWGALGLGFLCKGPIGLLVAAVALVPYLVAAGRLRSGLLALVSGWGLLLFAVLALSWPVPVLLGDPTAARVWGMEMAQKAGTSGVRHFRAHDLLATSWPGMTAPWSILAIGAALLPFLGRGRSSRPGIWFPWFWAMGNLAMFCGWSVAKPNYYLPCLPGMTLLIGREWVRICREAHRAGLEGLGARVVLQLHWVALFTVAVAAPVFVAQRAPEYRGWAMVGSLAMAVGVAAGAWAWRRGAEAGALAPLVAGGLAVTLIGYGAVAPAVLANQSHRTLAATLDRILPREVHSVMFHRDLDEGLWFYLRGRDLKPVPGSQAEYNVGFELAEELRSGTFLYNPAARRAREEGQLLDWLRRSGRESDFVLIRAETYDTYVKDPRFAQQIAGLAVPVYREPPLLRNPLLLLQARDAGPVAAATGEPLR